VCLTIQPSRANVTLQCGPNCRSPPVLKHSCRPHGCITIWCACCAEVVFVSWCLSSSFPLPAADLSAEDGEYGDPSTSGNNTTASMEPISTTAAASTSGSSSNNHNAAAAGAGGGNGGGVFGGLFGFNVPGGNGRVQNKIGDDDTTGHGRAASAVVAAAAAMAAAADARRHGNSGSS